MIVIKKAMKINSSIVLLNSFVIKAHISPLEMLKSRYGNLKKVLLKIVGLLNSSN